MPIATMSCGSRQSCTRSSIPRLYFRGGPQCTTSESRHFCLDCFREWWGSTHVESPCLRTARHQLPRLSCGSRQRGLVPARRATPNHDAGRKGKLGPCCVIQQICIAFPRVLKPCGVAFLASEPSSGHHFERVPTIKDNTPQTILHTALDRYIAPSAK